jgi:serine/threonine protein kinase
MTGSWVCADEEADGGVPQSRAGQGASANGASLGGPDVLRAPGNVIMRMPSERRISPDDFNFLKVLGKGNYGKVMLATLKGDTSPNQYYAIKVIKKSALIDDESLEHVLAENRVLQQIDHPFLVKLHYSFQTAVRGRTHGWTGGA